MSTVESELYAAVKTASEGIGNLERGEGVNNIPPIQQNSVKNGHDENKAYGNSYENKCATNDSIITNNKWNDTHNKQLTMHNKYTNDDVHTDDCVVHIMR